MKVGAFCEHIVYTTGIHQVMFSTFEQTIKSSVRKEGELLEKYEYCGIREYFRRNKHGVHTEFKKQ